MIRKNIRYYQELAEQLVNEGKVEAAIAAYHMALQIQPANSSIALALSKLLAQDDPQQAHVLLNRALSKTVTTEVRSLEDLKHPHTVADLLRHTHLFDAVYYRAANPNLADADDETLLRHYIQHGSAAGRSPNPLFDDAFYRSQHPEVVEQGLNPLAHYHYFGYKQGCDPHPLFNIAFLS